MLQNVYRIDGEIAYISLTRGQETMIDASDLELVLRHHWYASYSNHRKVYIARGCMNGKDVFMHRYLLNPSRDLVVDHINHNTLDNRRSNLRIVDTAENRINLIGPSSTNTSGVLNVALCHPGKSRACYLAAVTRHGKKRRKQFPCTPEGLASAEKQVQIWQEDINQTGHNYSRNPPIARSTSKTGIYGVSVNSGSMKPLYQFRCQSKQCKTSKLFPFTDEGLEAARQFSNQHHGFT